IHGAARRHPRLRAARARYAARPDEHAGLAVESELDASAARRRRDARVERDRPRAKIDALHLDVIAVADLRDVDAAFATHFGLQPGREGDCFRLDLLKWVQVLDGVRSRGAHSNRRDAVVGAIRELLDADRTFVAAAAGERAVVIEKERVTLVVDDAGMIREARPGAGLLGHDVPAVHPG